MQSLTGDVTYFSAADNFSPNPDYEGEGWSKAISKKRHWEKIPALRAEDAVVLTVDVRLPAFDNMINMRADRYRFIAFSQRGVADDAGWLFNGSSIFASPDLLRENGVNMHGECVAA